MDKQLRNTLRNVVTHCRRLLEDAVAESLQGQFGIHTDGTVEDTAHMGHLSEEDQQYREQILIHLEHIQAFGFKPKGLSKNKISFYALPCARSRWRRRGMR